MTDKILDIVQIIEKNMLCNFEIKGRKPKGRKIQKIDPDNIKKL